MIRTLVLAHRDVVDVLRPRAAMDQLTLGAQIDALARTSHGRRLPDPAPLALMGTQLLARTEISEPPPSAAERCREAKRCDGGHDDHCRPGPEPDRQRDRAGITMAGGYVFRTDSVEYRRIVHGTPRRERPRR